LKIVPFIGIGLILFFSNHATARYIVRPQDQAVFHSNKGVQYLNQGDPKKALFEFKTAVEISPEFTEGWSNLGLTYMYLKQYDKAKEAFFKSIKIDKKYPTPYNHLATLYYNQKNYPEALKWVEKAIKADKKYGDAYYNQGLIYMQMARGSGDGKNFASAEQSFRNATEANSRHYLANMELGNLYKDQKKYEQAIMRYKVALEIQPSAAGAWEGLGDVYLKQGKNEQAQWAFNKAVAASPKNVGSHLSLGLLYLQEKNFVLADKELALAYRQDPNNPRVIFNLAFAKLSRAEDVRGRKGAAAAAPLYQEAITVYKSLVEKFPKFADGAYNLGYVYGRLGDLSQAEKWYSKTLSIDPNYYQALFSLGIMKVETGSKEEGVQYLCRFQKVTQGQDLKPSQEVAKKIIAENGRCK